MEEDNRMLEATENEGFESNTSVYAFSQKRYLCFLTFKTLMQCTHLLGTEINKFTLLFDLMTLVLLLKNRKALNLNFTMHIA